MTATESEQPQPDQPSAAQAPDLRAAMSPVVAQRTVLLETLRHLLANVPGVLAGDDVEYVHQARVALRRLRAAQKTFATDEDDRTKDSRTLLGEIRWLGTLLGNVRDLDVLLTQTLPPIAAALAPDIDFDPLNKTLGQQRNAALRKVRLALRSARYRKLLDHLQRWLDTQAPGGDIALSEFALQALEQRWHKVRRLLRKLDTLDRTQRHSLRKRAKELRYALEFFAPLFETGKLKDQHFNGKRMERFLDNLKELQSILGLMNDSVATQQLLEKLIQKDAIHQYRAGVIIGWVAAAAKQSEAKLGAISKLLTKTKMF